MKDTIDVGVDELLAAADLVEVDLSKNRIEPVEMDTGSYDLTFFDAKALQSNNTNSDAPAADHLENSAVGLSIFLEEAQAALETIDMSVDQRFHIATIVSYVEALGKRFDIVRTPNWGRDRKQRGVRALARLLMGTGT